MQHFVRGSSFVFFRRVWGELRRKIMQRLSLAPHVTLRSYLRDALQKCSAGAVASLHVPRAYACILPPPSFPILIGGFHCFIIL
jgi:hypothetical protein